MKELTQPIAFKWLNFDRLSDEEIQNLIIPKHSPEENEDDNLYCFICGQAVTKIHYRTSIQGSREHTFANPAGIVFRIGCFRNAFGCSQASDFTDSFTWFPGYSWRYALCVDCQTHLGWVYRSSEGSQFYGLILVRLISPREKKEFPGKN